MITPLTTRIYQEIEETDSGSLSFADFMGRCLYDPDYGYYSSPSRRTIGREGDFFTSVSVGAGFGFFLGLAAEKLWQESAGKPEMFPIIEQGAHDGSLALDFLEGLQSRGGEFCKAVSYTIFEPDEARAKELETKVENARTPMPIQIARNVPETPAPDGLFFCNELLDAFPVHRLRWEKGAWKELRVGMRETNGEPGFRWVTEELTTGSKLADAADRIEKLERPEGFTTEICLEIEPWITGAARWFQKGHWWIIDYGREASEYYSPERTEGTLRGYRAHQRADDPFESPGEIDLTADVNFSEVERAAQPLGLVRTLYTDQHHFLIRAAEPWLKAIEQAGPEALAANQKRLRQFQTLTHPGLMGRAFKVAAYQRNQGSPPR